MEISWPLIINHLNCLNLLNLQNCSISQSINRGLGEGINRINLEEKIIQVQTYTCICDRLDKQYIYCLIKYIH